MRLNQEKELTPVQINQQPIFTSEEKSEFIMSINELIICACSSKDMGDRASNAIIPILNHVNDLIKADLDPLR